MLGITQFARRFDLGTVQAAVVAAGLASAIGLAGASTTRADQGVKFEEFLGDVCAGGSVSGGLVTQCEEVSLAPDPAAPLSTDSQNALTPTQNLSSNENVLFRAQALNRQINKRLDSVGEARPREPRSRVSRRCPRCPSTRGESASS